jgi:hypothetical protein
MFKGIVEATRQLFEHVFTMLMIVFVFPLVASCFLALLLGLQLFLFTIEGQAISSRVYSLPLLLLLVFRIETPLTLSTGSIFLFVWSIYFLCFLFAWLWRESFHKVLGKAFSRPLNQLLNNFLFALPIFACMLLLVVFLLHSLQESMGVPTGEPALPTNPFETFFLLTYSPLIEEIGFRLTPMGLFLIAYVFVTERKVVARLSPKGRLRLFLIVPFYPEKAKRIAGLRRVSVDGFGGISTAEWIMVLATSLIFGLAHLLSGVGWDIGKVTSTFLVGFVFSVAYLAYGFQAPLLLHWYFNYYFYTFRLASKLYPSTLSLEILIWLLTIITGFLGVSWFLVSGLNKIILKRKLGAK